MYTARPDALTEDDITRFHTAWRHHGGSAEHCLRFVDAELALMQSTAFTKFGVVDRISIKWTVEEILDTLTYMREQPQWTRADEAVWVLWSVTRFYE